MHLFNLLAIENEKHRAYALTTFANMAKFSMIQGLIADLLIRIAVLLEEGLTSELYNE